MINLNYLSLRALEYVVAVADNGSFIGAAKQCRVAPPSLSAQIKKLESSIRITVFERTTRRVFLTREGQQFVEQARRVLAEAGKLIALTGQPNLPFGGTLRLAAISTLGPYIFPFVLPQMRQLYPDLSLGLEEGFTRDLISKLLSGAVDGALLSFPFDEPLLSSKPLFEEPFMLAVPKTESKDSPEPYDLMLLDDGHCLQGQALAACSTLKRGKRHATSLETLKYMVAAGEGSTIVPALAATQNDPVDYLPVPGPNNSRTIALAWRRSDPHAQDFAALAKTLTEIVLPAGLVRPATPQPFSAATGWVSNQRSHGSS
ncbi:LysR family transcriptional regulator [Ensifer adhaerens]|uniref:LysR substrate-binding domain-containing protein n=1 Tax=Ensifer adhaerens TaxID=106592 RepID=UPI001CC085DD|nr:LysR substrate-binding domain-containing protein [Ensifer adhaerens]MBZ7924795.1 LysR family transcriptional regulator [Ensifer adhaerens]UAX95984.1 LysR family transcriptional regulator [Ensifer adhaerens]UAY04674.1 LysR family transcriptional regulator [Ensifer adhaerens]UAY10105.1 LysR family transcriptional regulator [Ensifer adhaerens]